MDKTQTPPGRDGGSEDSDKKEHYGRPVKAKDFAKHAKKELNKAMDKNKARKMYELADRLSKVDTSKLNEQQLVEHTGMIKRLGEELKAMKEGRLDELSSKLAFRAANAAEKRAKATAVTFPAASALYKQKEKRFVKYGKDAEEREHEAWELAQSGMSPAMIRKMRMKQAATESRDTGDDIDDIVEDYLDYLEQHGGFDYPTREEEKAAIMADIESGALHPDELEYAMSGNDMNEAPRDLHTSYNVVKLGGALNIDPRGLRMAISRGMQGNPTRTDMMTLSNAFLNLLKNSDDNAIQQFANLVKSGNPRAAAGKEVPQESTAAIAERNAFVDAMRQAKKGEKFTVGGKEYTKTTTHGDDKKVDEAISTEAYDRLKRVFDFSNFKG